MPKVIEVKAKNPDSNQHCVVNWDIGASLEEKTEMFTEAVVEGAVESQFKVVLQSGLRGAMKRGVDPQVYADSFKPGVRVAAIAVDPMAAAKAAFTQMSSEEKATFLESLRS